ncbi:MAG TPA: phage terminase large subunit [Nitrospiraceae bacterium]
MPEWRFTAAQQRARESLNGPATHIMLWGGSRSGKTALLVRQIVTRAIKARRSRHLIARFRFNHVKASIGLDTFPSVMEKCFPNVRHSINKEDWFAELENGSQIWFGGLDEKERVEKILGNEYATIFLNECSQISWESRNVALTRLAQNCTQCVDDVERPLKLKFYYDENPPSQSHWSYKLFIRGTDPESGAKLANASDYAHCSMNPEDNAANLPAAYLETLKALPGRMRRRFYEGLFSEATPNALFSEEMIDRWRVMSADLPQMVRIIVSVDPSGAKDAAGDGDDIGVVVAGLGVDGVAYLIEDCTVLAGPAVWGKVATSAFDRHGADCVVGEVNYGGAMVEHVIRTARPGTPFRMVHASRGKAIRAEPVSALMEQGKVRIVGYMRKLEDELCSFSTVGYLGDRSPNRADAAVWAISELFPAMTSVKREKNLAASVNMPQVANGWMA